MIYDIDFNKTSEDFIAPGKRFPVIQAILSMLNKPLQDFHYSTMILYRNDVLKRTRYNSQKIVMEEILNSVFGITSGPRIYLDSTDNNKDPLFFYKYTENLNKQYFSKARPKYFSKYKEYRPDFDLVINVPVAYTPLVRQIRAFSAKLIVAGIRYTVVTY
jgi:hypothetical protein